MAWKLWKSPAERAEEEFRKAYEKGVNQKDWGKAISSFMKAAELFRKAGQYHRALEAEALAAFYDAVSKRNSPQAWEAAAAALEKLGEREIMIPFRVVARDLAAEARLYSREIEAVERDDPEALEEVAKGYFALGNRELYIPKLFGEEVTTLTKGNKLMGRAFLIRGNQIANLDPEKALEYYTQAVNFFSAAAAEEAALAKELLNKTGKVARCWFCGRIIQGEELHFVYMEAEILPYIRVKFGSDSPSPLTDNNAVVACKVCASAINTAAEKIARRYYEMAIAEIRRVEAELRAEIRRLWAALHELKYSSSYSYRYYR